MQKVAVLAGGISDEREVSLRSGAAVARALTAAGYAVTVLDPSPNIDVVLPQLIGIDVVFPALHGTGGEDGSLQVVLEAHHIPFVGSGSLASAICFDKAAYTKLLIASDILVPETEYITFDEYSASKLIRHPHVIKPNDGGSSIDTFIIREPASRNEAGIQTAFKKYKKLLLQKLLVGTEITVAVVCDEALPVIEIIPPTDQEFDYDNKYNGATQELCPPKSVTTTVQAQAQSLALRLHTLTGCRDMSRSDFIISSDGAIYTLETNTIPGLTDQSLLPKAALQAGYDMPQLCDRLVKAALKRSY